MTQYIIFQPNENNTFYDKKISKQLPNIPLGFINKADKIGGQKSKGMYSYGIEVKCKDFRVYRFYFPKVNHSRRFIFSKLVERAFINDLRLTFSFFHKSNSSIDLGWFIYDPLKEYKRQGIESTQKSKWKIVDWNSEFGICTTYPKYLVIPSNISQSHLEKLKKFRTKQRIPVLTWRNPKKLNTICRSSQPKVGVARSKNESDEKLILVISQKNPSKLPLQIYDCRPKANAVANKAKGGGFESLNNYKTSELTFLGIDNIHTMRESFTKLINSALYSFNDDKKWFAELDNSGWLIHIQKLVYWAVKGAKLIDSDYSLLVHCSDGWDRTTQICTLIQLLCDPYYRTLEGFIVLIEKDWISFGHKFSQRIGHANEKSNDNQRSPIFIQWIDSVYQIWQQFPHAFQFNEEFLITIYEHSISLRFGTQNTASLWTFIYDHKIKFLNEVYEEVDGLIYPSYSLRHLIFWERLYLRHMGFVGNFTSLIDSNRQTEQNAKEMIDNLQKLISKLKKSIEELKEKLII
ncbi:myotubularin-related [Anaeramoeba ignava]|uniref:Myotubularin-related n=1 Tax=Anaeramoeba ignava TaxID=1746090 RepID=A0A9Q0LUW2_ANAIG|nr:myotubularin-related [Anaeramoeba ignava]